MLSFCEFLLLVSFEFFVLSEVNGLEDQFRIISEQLDFQMHIFAQAQAVECRTRDQDR